MQSPFIERIQNFIDIWNKSKFKPCLVHGDYGLGHSYYKGDRVIGALDWGASRIDDPAYDWQWKKGIYESTRVFDMAFSEYKKHVKVDNLFMQRVQFYIARKPMAKFWKGVEYNDNQRIRDGFKMLERDMAISIIS